MTYFLYNAPSVCKHHTKSSSEWQTKMAGSKSSSDPEIEIQVEETKASSEGDNMLYKVDDTPPWYLSILLGFQHYLTAFGSTLSVPLVLQSAMCIGDDRVGLSEIISTIFFVSGLSTLLQTTFGVRLPIIQGATFSFLTPTFTILALKKWECPFTLAAKGEWNVTSDPLPDPGSPEHKEMWQMRMREIQGAIMVSSIFEIVIGFSGVIGLFLHFIGPLVIVPTISLIGLSLFKEAADLASKSYLMYVGQWGLPTVSVSAVFGMLAGVLASIIESVGDYYACAKLAGAPPPPVHAINRGIGMEGIGCLLAGAWGSGNGTTSYSENIGAIGITRVGSRRVVQMGGLIMMILGCLGKFGALFVTIPDPVIGGLFMVTFGMVVAVGLSNLQFVDLSSSRNIFIIGTSIFFGLSFPNWMKTHPGYIDTGSDILDQLLSVLLGTSMFVGGTIGFILDNTIPGTLEERGILRWRQKDESWTASGDNVNSVYDLPCIQKYLNKLTITRYLPFCPNFQPCCGKGSKKQDPPVEPTSVYEKKVDDTNM